MTKTKPWVNSNELNENPEFLYEDTPDRKQIVVAIQK